MNTIACAMRAALILLATAWLTGANAREEPLPIPPIPPTQMPPDAAPLPDWNMRNTFDKTERSLITLDTTINHRPAPATGSGFAPGTRYQLDNDRKLTVPGLMLHLPFP
jgi:hypothetical protein